MKIVKRFYEDDFKEMIKQLYNVTDSQITTCYTETTVGYGVGEHTEPIFYIEVEESEHR